MFFGLHARGWVETERLHPLCQPTRPLLGPVCEIASVEGPGGLDGRTKRSGVVRRPLSGPNLVVECAPVSFVSSGRVSFSDPVETRTACSMEIFYGEQATFGEGTEGRTAERRAAVVAPSRLQRLRQFKSLAPTRVKQCNKTLRIQK